MEIEGIIKRKAKHYDTTDLLKIIWIDGKFLRRHLPSNAEFCKAKRVIDYPAYSVYDAETNIFTGHTTTRKRRSIDQQRIFTPNMVVKLNSANLDIDIHCGDVVIKDYQRIFRGIRSQHISHYGSANILGMHETYFTSMYISILFVRQIVQDIRTKLNKS